MNDAHIASEIARWYRGAVVNLQDLRPRTRILDPAVPTLLRTAKQPTFVTVNYNDFWNKIAASPDYCVVCLKLRQDETRRQVSDLLRSVLSLHGLRTKRERMGAVGSVVDRKVAVYRD